MIGIAIGVIALALTTLMLRRIEPKVTRAADAAPAQGTGLPGFRPDRVHGQPQPPKGRMSLRG